MGTLPRDIGRKVRSARLRLELTQSELAGRLDLEEATVRAIEAGRRGVSVETLLRLADALGTSPGELINPPEKEGPRVERELRRLVEDLPEPWQRTALRILRELHRQVVASKPGRRS